MSRLPAALPKFVICNDSTGGNVGLLLLLLQTCDGVNALPSMKFGLDPISDDWFSQNSPQTSPSHGFSETSTTPQQKRGFGLDASIK